MLRWSDVTLVVAGTPSRRYAGPLSPRFAGPLWTSFTSLRWSSFISNRNSMTQWYDPMHRSLRNIKLPRWLWHVVNTHTSNNTKQFVAVKRRPPHHIRYYLVRYNPTKLAGITEAVHTHAIASATEWGRYNGKMIVRS